MLLNEFSNLKRIVLALVCGVAFCVGVLAASVLVKSGKPVPNDASQGFDFSSSTALSNPSAGPPNGTQLNLARLKTRDGEVLANVISKPLTMLVTVDPDCGACKVASDEMRDVQSRVEPLGMSVTATVTSPQASADFFSYTDSFGFNSPGFLWAKDEEKPPEALFTMVVPSHILIDRNGVVEIRFQQPLTKTVWRREVFLQDPPAAAAGADKGVLVFEVTNTGEDHCDVLLITSRNHFRVAH